MYAYCTALIIIIITASACICATGAVTILICRLCSLHAHAFIVFRPSTIARRKDDARHISSGGRAVMLRSECKWTAAVLRSACLAAGLALQLSVVRGEWGQLQ